MYDDGGIGAGFGYGFMAGGMLIWLIAAILFLWFYGRILARAGFSGWWAVLALLPVVNLVMLWVFAFIRWPAIDEYIAEEDRAGV